MLQAVSRRPLTAEAPGCLRVCSCEQSGIGTAFSQSSSVFPCQYNSIVDLETISLGMNNMLVCGRSLET
jgi:hypothetical protein